MKFFSEWKSKIKNGLSSAAVFIYIVLGVIFIVASFIWLDEKNIWYKIFYTVGTTMLAGGVFGSIAKSSQFTDIFSKILRDIIYGKEHLDNRSDLEQIWENVTEVLSKKKFNKINGEMQKNIKKYFLPVDHDYYYDNFNIDINIEYDDDDRDYVIVKEITTFNLVCEDEKQKIKNQFSCIIKMDMSKMSGTKYSLNKLQFNSIDHDGKCVSTVEGNKYIFKYEKELTGKKYHQIRREDEKRFNIKYNPIKSQIAVWVYNNIRMDITYPKDLDLEIRGLGLLNELSIDDKANKVINRKVVEYKGLIYKNQGVFILFKA
ncbi:hypothetical protein ABE425_04975 [Chryseobacterium cucumeris]|uniref:hypothetical protein n=1 Tax=Chryseobacterium cucumeris TaxID=1813611 RepID=UPI003208D68D